MAPRCEPPAIDPLRCTGCGRCVAACPNRLLSLEVQGFRKLAVRSDTAACTRCQACREACPHGAISPPYLPA
jgi:ferredoxin